jgi:hypothetical protein
VNKIKRLERNKDPSGGYPHWNTRIDSIVFFAFHPSDHERTGANMDRTNSKIDTPATRESSRGVLEQTRRDLIVMREAYGADTPVGHRCSNIVELLQMPELPKALLARQMADLVRLRAVLQ